MHERPDRGDRVGMDRAEAERPDGAAAAVLLASCAGEEVVGGALPTHHQANPPHAPVARRRAQGGGREMFRELLFRGIEAEGLNLSELTAGSAEDMAAAIKGQVRRSVPCFPFMLFSYGEYSCVAGRDAQTYGNCKTVL